MPSPERFTADTTGQRRYIGNVMYQRLKSFKYVITSGDDALNVGGANHVGKTSGLVMVSSDIVYILLYKAKRQPVRASAYA